MVSVVVLADGKPDELMTVPLVRGRFCELLAPLAGTPGHSSDLFLMGLLSVMDAIIDQPLDSILADLPVRREIKEALLARTGLYWLLLEIAIAHERADWEKVSALVSEACMDEEQVSALYIYLRRGLVHRAAAHGSCPGDNVKWLVIRQKAARQPGKCEK